MTSRARGLALLLWAAGTLAVCGVKAPPRPPLAEAAVEASSSPDAGACATCSTDGGAR